jgi:hypothetical protein
VTDNTGKCTWGESDGKLCGKPAANDVNRLCAEHEVQFRENVRRRNRRVERARTIANRFVGDDNVKNQACVDDIVELIEVELDAEFKRRSDG